MSNNINDKLLYVYANRNVIFNKVYLIKLVYYNGYFIEYTRVKNYYDIEEGDIIIKEVDDINDDAIKFVISKEGHFEIKNPFYIKYSNEYNNNIIVEFDIREMFRKYIINEYECDINILKKIIVNDILLYYIEYYDYDRGGIYIDEVCGISLENIIDIIKKKYKRCKLLKISKRRCTMYNGYKYRFISGDR